MRQYAVKVGVGIDEPRREYLIRGLKHGVCGKPSLKLSVRANLVDLRSQYANPPARLRVLAGRIDQEIRKYEGSRLRMGQG
jgi:hypothetical protein